MHPIFITVYTLPHTHMHGVIEAFLQWSKRGDMKSNKSCMVAGGRQHRHGDVQMKRDESARVSVCVTEDETESDTKKQSVCVCR